MSNRSTAKKGKRKHPGATSPDIASRRYKRWNGKQEKCKRCQMELRKGQLAVAVPEHDGWIHASCPPHKGLSKPGEKTGSHNNTGGGPSNGRGSAQARTRAKNRNRVK